MSGQSPAHCPEPACWRGPSRPPPPSSRLPGTLLISPRPQLLIPNHREPPGSWGGIRRACEWGRKATFIILPAVQGGNELGPSRQTGAVSSGPRWQPHSGCFTWSQHRFQIFTFTFIIPLPPPASSSFHSNPSQRRSWDPAPKAGCQVGGPHIPAEWSLISRPPPQGLVPKPRPPRAPAVAVGSRSGSCPASRPGLALRTRALAECRLCAHAAPHPLL